MPTAAATATAKGPYAAVTRYLQDNPELADNIKKIGEKVAGTGTKGTNFLSTYGPGLAMTAADLGTDYLTSKISP